MKKFARFCVIGICNTAITFVIYYILLKIIGINYMMSSLIGYIAGIINSFALNKRWTFRNRSSKVLAQFARFIMVNLVSLGVNLIAIYACVDWMNIDKIPAQLVAMGFSTIVNFLGSKLVVFHEKQSGAENEEILGYLK